VKMLRIARSAPLAFPSAWRLARRGLSPAPRPFNIRLETFSEQTPDPESRVTLSSRLDEFGLRRAKIDWRLDSLTGHTLRTFTKIVGHEFQRLGLGRLKPADWLSESAPKPPEVVDSYHPSGTTRMAITPSLGVVDANCQVFGVDGLYVAGSSVFPVSGVANPTYTIAALAIRLADHITRRVQDRHTRHEVSARTKSTAEVS
jgi:choline dehydrogenase-like flavoprotein